MPYPLCLISYAISVMPYPLCCISYVLSVMPYQLCHIDYALSVMPYPLCCISYVLSVMPYPLCHIWKPCQDLSDEQWVNFKTTHDLYIYIQCLISCCVCQRLQHP